MKLTIVQEKQNILYTNDDFIKVNLLNPIKYIYDNEIGINDVSTRNIPEETTHLLLDAVIKIDSIQLNRLKKLEYIGTTYTGWWDKYFDVKEIADGFKLIFFKSMRN